jgi:hypothetical protein
MSMVYIIMSLMFNNLYSCYKLFTNNTYANDYIYYRKTIEEELKEINKYHTRRLYGDNKIEKKRNKNSKRNKDTGETVETTDPEKTTEPSGTTEIEGIKERKDLVDELFLLEKGISDQQKLQEQLQEEIQLIIDESLYNIVDIEESEEDAYTLV